MFSASGDTVVLFKCSESMNRWLQVIRSPAVTVLMFALLLPPSPLLFLQMSAIVSGSPSNRELGHVSDEEMEVDVDRVTGDFEKIGVAKAFFLEHTAELRRPRDCSDAVPKDFRGMLAPNFKPNPKYNATDAAVAREILGSST